MGQVGATVPILYTGKLRQSARGSWDTPPRGALSRRPPCPPSLMSPQALVDLLLTGGVAAATAMAWHRVSPPAARLLYPYLAWLAFAAVLNYCVWRDNRGWRGGRRFEE